MTTQTTIPEARRRLYIGVQVYRDEIVDSIVTICLPEYATWLIDRANEDIQHNIEYDEFGYVIGGDPGSVKTFRGAVRYWRWVVEHVGINGGMFMRWEELT